jgi:alpha-tubulin suppressor-like RCC1 family protein
VPVRGLADAVEIAAGGTHTCALTREGAVVCWGANFAGQLGDGETGEARPDVAPVVGLGPAVAIAAGDAHTCAISTERHLYCWGNNGDGQLGDGSTTTQSRPTLVPLAGVSKVAAGRRHGTCAILSWGEVRCWGANGAGEIGDGTRDLRWFPTAVPCLGPATDVALGPSHTCAILADDSVRCWGANYAGEIGEAPRDRGLMPRPVPF